MAACSTGLRSLSDLPSVFSMCPRAGISTLASVRRGLYHLAPLTATPPPPAACGAGRWRTGQGSAEARRCSEGEAPPAGPRLAEGRTCRLEQGPAAASVHCAGTCGIGSRTVPWPASATRRHSPNCRRKNRRHSRSCGPKSRRRRSPPIALRRGFRPRRSADRRQTG